jgi:hypothetical protein
MEMIRFEITIYNHAMFRNLSRIEIVTQPHVFLCQMKILEFQKITIDKHAISKIKFRMEITY